MNINSIINYTNIIYKENVRGRFIYLFREYLFRFCSVQDTLLCWNHTNSKFKALKSFQKNNFKFQLLQNACSSLQFSYVSLCWSRKDAKNILQLMLLKNSEAWEWKRPIIMFGLLIVMNSWTPQKGLRNTQWSCTTNQAA